MNIPNFQNQPVTSQGGYFTDCWQLIMQALINELQENAGPEGLVVPTQTSTNITTIQNATNASGAFTCQYGTLLYDSTDNTLKVALNNGSGQPQFYTIGTSGTGDFLELFA